MQSQAPLPELQALASRKGRREAIPSRAEAQEWRTALTKQSRVA